MRKQRKMNLRNDFHGSKAKTMPKVQDKVDVEVDAYPKSVESTIQNKIPVGGKKRKTSAAEYLSYEESTVVPSEPSYISIPVKRKRQHLAYDQDLPSTIKPKPLDEKCYNVPKMTPEEQLKADTIVDEFNRISAGARVMAFWDGKYYAAFVCGNNPLGRYYVVFDEDKFKQTIPYDGVIPISFLTTSTKVMFITNIDGKEMAKVAEISKQPSKDDPRLWADGMFEMKFSKDAGSEEYQTESVPWSKIYVTKDQAATIKMKRTSGFQLWEGNIDFPKRSRKSSTPQQNAARKEETTVTNEPNKEGKIFAGLNFIVTTAPRPNKESNFKKWPFYGTIEGRGGKLINKNGLKTLHDTENTFLISDTHYRTEKYLLALSLSLPCVSYQWIIECVTANKILPYEKFMLPAGETSLDPGRIYEWKPLKGTLLLGKKVMVYSNAPTPRLNDSFVRIWSPIVENLGAELIEPIENGGPISQKLEFINSNAISILLTDSACEKEVAQAVESKGGGAVSSDWLIHALITGELATPNSSPIFRYDYVE